MQFLVFSYYDSWVDPCKILDFKLGEAVVVCNVTNLVAPCGHTHEENESLLILVAALSVAFSPTVVVMLLIHHLRVVDC